jgi:hypothetical protein
MRKKGFKLATAFVFGALLMSPQARGQIPSMYSLVTRIICVPADSFPVPGLEPRSMVSP